jgi:hypothetical protein
MCTGFHHAIVDSLYESITVDNSDVCTTLAECPYLAKKVKSFIFTYPTIMDYDGPEVHMNDLALALKNMTCLSTLKLIHSQNYDYTSVLQYCDAELHVFHCTYHVDHQLLSFLNRQDSIRELALLLARLWYLSVLGTRNCLPPHLCHILEKYLPILVFY